MKKYLQSNRSYVLSKNSAIIAIGANGRENALVSPKKNTLKTGQTHPNKLSNLRLRTLTKEFLHPISHLALSKNSVNSVKSVKTLFSCLCRSPDRAPLVTVEDPSTKCVWTGLHFLPSVVCSYPSTTLRLRSNHSKSQLN